MIIFSTYSAAFGGAERLLLDFAGGIEEPCAVACPEGKLATSARAAGLEVFPLPPRRLNLRVSPRERMLAVARLAAHGRELRRLVNQTRPRVMVAWGMRSALACLLGPRLRCPVVFQHNDLTPGVAIGRLLRAAAGRAALTITLSEAIANDLDPARRLGPRLRVVHPGVDVDRFDQTRAPAHPPTALVLGAIVPWKRPELALEACALARRRHPELRLRFVGEPFADDGERLLHSLRLQAAELGFAELPGASADPYGELARSYCLLHCAEREPFGMAVLEALAAGRPAVVPAAAGPAEIVDSSCGLLYAPGDAGAAAAALSTLLDDPAHAAQLGRAGRERASREFGRAAAQRRYAAALAPLLARGR